MHAKYKYLNIYLIIIKQMAWFKNGKLKLVQFFYFKMVNISYI